MAKVSMTIGLNVKLKNDGNPESRFDRFTPAVTIAEIDTEKDIPEQIEVALAAADTVWKSISDFIGKQIEIETGHNPIEEK
jgi:hypothetical protein